MFKTWIWDGKAAGNHSELDSQLNDGWMIISSFSGEGDTWMFLMHKCPEDHCKYCDDDDD